MNDTITANKDKPCGSLLIIGGHEDKVGECLILRQFIDMAGGRNSQIVVIATATGQPRLVGNEYRQLFSSLGVATVTIMAIVDREAANQQEQAEIIKQATGIFFTGGDQLRFTSILGGSAVDAAIRAAFRQGAVIAGTSAGAAVMSETMIVAGNSNDTPKKSSLIMAQGMGFLTEGVVDQHFAQRGRINRLLEAVAQNPHVLGIGIDEDTALVVGPDRLCQVIGSQTVTIIDGKGIIYSNISESNRYQPLAISNVLLHILPAGFGFDLNLRLPLQLATN
ncbi:Cyanophycinase [Sporomusa silvacetica DSM 10669]|uniref:Cyanophycinase n=1 Tax=Sporomusa silvacetica DSM 10669 TaxID=1123289 RepID=A0ABZ3IER9_9FIRM|nr:cyanophycinase [Sporomusa silvacetica]OZC17887.1 cyanophycinase [Sporomusa silvacetica DSM 10669]